MGYMGDYTSDGACCGDGSATMAPMQMAPMQPGATITVPQGGLAPSPGADQ
jgi:hypothetical protein